MENITEKLRNKSFVNRNSEIRNCIVRQLVFSGVIPQFQEKTLTITAVLNAITAISAIFGNSFIILVLLRRPQLRTTSNIILFCLALTDLSVGLAVQPTLAAINVQFLTRKKSDCGLYVIYDLVKYASGLCSACVSILVSVDCSAAVCVPFRYVRLATEKRALVVCACVWIASVSVSVLRLFVRGRQFSISFITTLSITFVIVSILYVKMLRIADKHRIQIEEQSRRLVQRNLRKRKALKTAMAIIITYLLCYLPYIIARIYFLHVKTSRTHRYAVMLWPKTLLYINSSLNPFILFWRLKNVRKALLETFKRNLQGT